MLFFNKNKTQNKHNNYYNEIYKIHKNTPLIKLPNINTNDANIHAINV